MSSHSSATIDYAASLNKEQYAAVTAPPGPILVIAGAGSGKTRTLTYRVAYLVENGVEPENILLLTFTNKAAREMLHRVSSLLPHDISRIWGGTFHHIGNRLLRRHADLLGYTRDFTILDQDDAKSLVAACLSEAGVDTKDPSKPKADVIQEIFSLSVNKEVPIRQILISQYPYFLQDADQIERLYPLYREKKKSSNVMDYDDLLQLSLTLLRSDAIIAARYQEQFQHILVDEYQDTNKIQADLIDALAVMHRQVMVVGDDAQSIYSWRGANFENILSFPERYEGAQVIKIETNYRSAPEILHLANVSIAGNTRQFKKNLRAMRVNASCPKPAEICVRDGNQQALFIANRIQELHEEEGVNLDEIAVLYRAHFHAMELQMELTRRDIPFEITSGLRFFEQAHVKDASAYLKLAVNPKDEVAFKRIAGMLPGIGTKTADKLWREFASGRPLESLKPPGKAEGAWKQWVETQRQLTGGEVKKSPAEQIRLVMEAVYEDYMKSKFTNYQNRVEDLAQLQVYAERFPGTEEFLAELSLQTNLDDRGGEKQKAGSGSSVRLSTVHQAKGLEWKVVFVIMLCDGLFPSKRVMDSPEGEEEERRLFYVAVTRAKDELYLTYPEVRAGNGGGEFWQKPSRFLEELPRAAVNRWHMKTGAFT